ncbi:hypothetical protein A3Q56_03951 [Intoshia linei]|uniref:Uncharacterized protein n=1 Tax=Intoshia linei TaxID=1819745 RepID=A0A177B3U7_9BILA|nr:hypothetical protein A3Q56_03951 [Intoshia linei]
MGLGKTIQTIALLAHLASFKAIWGPHLVIVPTSVMLNWEIEFKKWCPALKILTYYGSHKERSAKRKGWTRSNAFHVCITSYNIAMQDATKFRRMQWHYLILDEAHHIKNYRSQRWQTLLGFKSRKRLLLTGTPLQNSLMELWSLMHFLMPSVFESHLDFKDWFDQPISELIESGKNTNIKQLTTLHKVLRPFILRRLKDDVEKQLPKKHEHIIRCRMSKRQRFLYDDFMSKSDTRQKIVSGSFLNVANVLMQLRKVCNHPDLFDPRPVSSPFFNQSLQYQVPTIFLNLTKKKVDVSLHNCDMTLTSIKFFKNKRNNDVELKNYLLKPNVKIDIKPPPSSPFLEKIALRRASNKRQRILRIVNANSNRIYKSNALYTSDLIKFVTIQPKTFCHVPSISDENIKKFSIYHDKVKSDYIKFTPSKYNSKYEQNVNDLTNLHKEIKKTSQPFDALCMLKSLIFPENRLIQYDSGKLQALDKLLRDLHNNSHRVLIFTQMTKVLDILEIFLCYHNYKYFRLDGSTKIEKRQALMERFNCDDKIFCFILSTRSGGLGINLIGADCVIFYDSDWNPTMDAQAQDRCHRIGQTRDVHIYRLVSEFTIEENILNKANQKKLLGDLAIENGSFTTEFFEKTNINDIFENVAKDEMKLYKISQDEINRCLFEAEDEEDVEAAKKLQSEVKADKVDFDDDFRDELIIEHSLENDEYKFTPVEQFSIDLIESSIPKPDETVQNDTLYEPMSKRAKNSAYHTTNEHPLTYVKTNKMQVSKMKNIYEAVPEPTKKQIKCSQYSHMLASGASLLKYSAPKETPLVVKVEKNKIKKKKNCKVKTIQPQKFIKENVAQTRSRSKNVRLDSQHVERPHVDLQKNRISPIKISETSIKPKPNVLNTFIPTQFKNIRVFRLPKNTNSNHVKIISNSANFKNSIGKPINIIRLNRSNLENIPSSYKIRIIKPYQIANLNLSNHKSFLKILCHHNYIKMFRPPTPDEKPKIVNNKNMLYHNYKIRDHVGQPPEKISQTKKQNVGKEITHVSNLSTNRCPKSLFCKNIILTSNKRSSNKTNKGMPGRIQMNKQNTFVIDRCQWTIQEDWVLNFVFSRIYNIFENGNWQIVKDFVQSVCDNNNRSIRQIQNRLDHIIKIQEEDGDISTHPPGTKKNNKAKIFLNPKKAGANYICDNFVTLHKLYAARFTNAVRFSTGRCKRLSVSQDGNKQLNSVMLPDSAEYISPGDMKAFMAKMKLEEHKNYIKNKSNNASTMSVKGKSVHIVNHNINVMRGNRPTIKQIIPNSNVISNSFTISNNQKKYRQCSTISTLKNSKKKMLKRQNSMILDQYQMQKMNTSIHFQNSQDNFISPFKKPTVSYSNVNIRNIPISDNGRLSNPNVFNVRMNRSDTGYRQNNIVKINTIRKPNDHMQNRVQARVISTRNLRFSKPQNPQKNIPNSTPGPIHIVRNIQSGPKIAKRFSVQQFRHLLKNQQFINNNDPRKDSSSNIITILPNKGQPTNSHNQSFIRMATPKQQKSNVFTEQDEIRTYSPNSEIVPINANSQNFGSKIISNMQRVSRSSGYVINNSANFASSVKLKPTQIDKLSPQSTSQIPISRQPPVQSFNQPLKFETSGATLYNNFVKTPINRPRCNLDKHLTLRRVLNTKTDIKNYKPRPN